MSPIILLWMHNFCLPVYMHMYAIRYMYESSHVYVYIIPSLIITVFDFGDNQFYIICHLVTPIDISSYCMIHVDAINFSSILNL